MSKYKTPRGTARKLRRESQQRANAAIESIRIAVAVRHHVWDEDGCCDICGFDGAEWSWWKNHTYEGKAMPNARIPSCQEVRS